MAPAEISPAKLKTTDKMILWRPGNNQRRQSLNNSNPFATQSTVTSIGSSNSNVSSTAASMAISGLASGMNWTSIVQELGTAERSPEIQWQNQQTTIAAQNAAYTTIQTDLQSLQTDAQTLLDPSFFNSVVASSSSPAVASANAASGTPVGNFSFNISQLATAAQINGATDVSQKLVPDGIPADVTIGTAGFSTAVSDGNFTVNGDRSNHFIQRLAPAGV